MFKPNRRTAAISLASIGLMGMRSLRAEQWPAKPVVVVFPFPAGNAADASVRDIARKLSAVLGQSVVVENRPGGASLIGAQAVARAKPDGYTLLAAGGATLVTGPLLNPKIKFDPLRDVTVVCQVTDTPLVLAASRHSGIRSLADFLARVRARPGQVSVSSFGIGTPAHLAIELLKIREKIDFVHVPYSAGQSDVLDIRSGRLDATMTILPIAMESITTDDAIGLAIGSTSRSDHAPSIPSFDELGLKDMSISAWIGLAVPNGTPQEIVNKLSEAVKLSVADSQVKTSFATRRMGLRHQPAESFLRMIQSEIDLTASLIKSVGIPVNN